jgi:hypothetical protein
MNMDRDKKKETSKVNQGIIVCGQQIATADIALFSRFVALGFSKTIFTQEETQAFFELEKLNKQGLTQITHQLLKLREEFAKFYNKTVDETSETFRELLGSSQIETRIYNNWLTVASAYATIAKLVELPLGEDQAIKIFVRLMTAQNGEVSRSDELGVFWKTVQFLINSNMLFEGGDYKVLYTDRIVRTYKDKGEWHKGEIFLEEPQNVLFLSVSRIFGLYKSQSLREGDSPMPDATIDYYLRNSPAFICGTKKESFKKMDAKTGCQLYYPNGKGRFTNTSAYVFRLDGLGLNLEVTLADL